MWNFISHSLYFSEQILRLCDKCIPKSVIHVYIANELKSAYGHQDRILFYHTDNLIHGKGVKVITVTV